MTVASDTSAESAPLAPENPTFDILPLSREVQRAIESMGWSNPTPVQIQAYRLAVEHHDLLVQSRTGTGKTGAFGIPLVDRLVEPGKGTQALVLAPTRELALQSAGEIAKIGRHRSIRTSAVYGGASMEKQVKELEEGAEIVSGTPGRVLDHLRRGTLDASSLKILVLDEADEMLSMGFAKELHAILELLPRDRQTMLFSATVDGPVTRMAERHMRDPEFIALSGDAVGALGVTHYVYFVSGVGRASDLARILEVEDPESAIIFCNTKAETEQVAESLRKFGYDAEWLNGDMAQSDREKIMARTRARSLRFLVATDVAARGIDISHLTHVINYSLPAALEQYIHRTGRTGRAGKTGTAIALVSPPELGQLYYLRLQYRINPVERSLPTRGEERTRVEADRLALLERAFDHAASDLDLSVARRLATHPDADRILAGLVSAFFAGVEGNVDAIASAARRAVNPAQVIGSALRTERASDDAAAPTTSNQSAAPTDSSDADVDPNVRSIYVNIGKRDDAKHETFIAWLLDAAGLTKELLTKVKVKDRHSFVEVALEHVDAVVANIKAARWNDREVVAEVARGR